jgi:hypothetical protein
LRRRVLAHDTRPAFAVERATEPAVLDEARRLLHDEYVARGYMKPAPGGVRIGFHHALPATHVYVGRDAGRVVATIALIPDTVHGLPCDALYPWELAAMRARGERLAEVSAFAIDPRYRSTGREAVRALVHAVAAAATRFTTLCITVNPRHARFYEARLGFERFGPVKACGAVDGAPAVPLRLDVRRAAARLKSLHLVAAANDSPACPATEVC